MKNNQGFMLAEVIVVSVIITVTLVSLYAGFNRIYNSYNQRNKYYDIDNVYVAKLIEKYLVDELKMNQIINEARTSNFYNISNCTDQYMNSNQDYCNKIKEVYDIKNIYFVKEIYETLNITSASATLNDYIKYLSANTSSSNNTYAIIIETNDYNYGMLKVN